MITSIVNTRPSGWSGVTSPKPTVEKVTMMK